MVASNMRGDTSQIRGRMVTLALIVEAVGACLAVLGVALIRST